MFGLRDSFVYFQCAECRVPPDRRVSADMSRYYPASYYSVCSGLRTQAPFQWGRGGGREPRERVRCESREGLLGRVLYWMSPNEDLRKRWCSTFPETVSHSPNSARSLSNPRRGMWVGDFSLGPEQGWIPARSGGRPVCGGKYRISRGSANPQGIPGSMQGAMERDHVSSLLRASPGSVGGSEERCRVVGQGAGQSWSGFPS